MTHKKKKKKAVMGQQSHKGHKKEGNVCLIQGGYLTDLNRLNFLKRKEKTPKPLKDQIKLLKLRR